MDSANFWLHRVEYIGLASEIVPALCHSSAVRSSSFSAAFDSTTSPLPTFVGILASLQTLYLRLRSPHVACAAFVYLP